MLNQFQCPANAEIYFEQVVRRVDGYIKLGIWDVTMSDLNGWLSNFASPEEKHLAACLLDEVIFRTEAQMRGMISQLLQRTLADALARPGEFGQNWEALLANETDDPKMRLAPVIRDDDSPAKSGPLVARLFRRIGGVSDKWMIWPWQIQRVIRRCNPTIVIIDDFLGSGKQFVKFATFAKLKKISTGTLIYAPLIAHPEGIAAITDLYPNIRVVPGETLENGGGIMRSSFGSFDNLNSSVAAQELYKSYWRRRGIKLNKKVLFGWEKLSLAVAFAHGTPNATLPLFWMNQAPHKLLFAR